MIGCGYWGPKLARNFFEMPEAELAWVSDFRTDRLEHIQSLYPAVRATHDHRELLASDVEGVVIATPVSTHHALALEGSAGRQARPDRKTHRRQRGPGR